MLTGDGFHTDRYPDPPVLENFTNTGNGGGFSGSYEREVSDRDRVRVTVTHNLAGFLALNCLVQENAGQQQNIADMETSGQVSLQHLSRSLVERFRQRAGQPQSCPRIFWPLP